MPGDLLQAASIIEGRNDWGPELRHRQQRCDSWEQSWLSKTLIQMAVAWHATFRKIKNEHGTELYHGSQEWKHQQGAGQLPSSDLLSSF